MDDFSKNTDSLGKKAEEILERAQNGSLNHDIEATLDTVLSSVANGVGKTFDHVNQEMEKTRQRAAELEQEIRQSKQSGGSFSNYRYQTTRRSSDKYGNRQNIPYGAQNKTAYKNGYSSYGRGYAVPVQQTGTARTTRSICKPPGNGLAERIVGGILTGTFGFLEGLFLLVGLFEYDSGLGIAFGMFFPFLAVSVALLTRGILKKKRLNRYMKYVREMQGKPYGSIEEMAKAINKSKDYVVKDLRKMIADGIFPDGRIDDKEEYLMVTREVYEDYRRAENSRKQREAEEKKTRQEKEAEEKKRQQMTEVEETILEGRTYLEEIFEANEALEGEVISAKLDRLYDVVDKILFCVEKQPEKLEEIRQFMKYYLPTTLKLVKAYREFEENTIQGNNIQTAKNEIELSLDTINDGFERLLNNLFEQDAMDISTDIYVLQNMLAREGLTENPFEDIYQPSEDPFADGDFGEFESTQEGSVLESNE